MRSYIYKALLLTGLCAVQVRAISLYDTAPVVGLPVSHAVRYSAYARLGYDDNINSSYVDKSSSLYVNAGFNGSYADHESVDKVTYSFNLGATRYLSSGDSEGQKMYSDSNLSASLVHAFSARSTYMGSLALSYSPEPDYASGISASRQQGDCLYWSTNHSYNQSIDSRWSWNVAGGYSGNLYSETEYQRDNRQYVNCSAGLNYRASELLSYNYRFNYRYDLREYGYNSNNLTLSAGFSLALDPVSSCSGSIGLQSKLVGGKTILTPNINLGYNRRVSDGLSVNSYLTLSNENVDTYRGIGASYLSDVTWRLGVNCNYRLSPDVSYMFGVSLMSSSYSKGTQRMADEKNVTINPTFGMTYRFSEQLSGNINYSYTWYETRRSGDSNGYERHNVSMGLTYTF